MRGTVGTSAGVSLRAVRELLARFDVVGITERLATTMFLVCDAIGLELCPTLPPLKTTGHDFANWRADTRYNADMLALVARFAAADVSLHVQAKARLKTPDSARRKR